MIRGRLRRPMIRGRLRRLRGAEGHEEDLYIEIEPGELSRLFAAPSPPR